jgi:para-nitrobenzyl esterase
MANRTPSATPISTSARGGGSRLWVILTMLLALALLAAACSDEDSDPGDEESSEDQGATGDDADEDESPDDEPSGDPLLIETDLGEVQGADSEVEGVRQFLAIPYAADPSGDNAFRAPQPRDPYEGVFDATAPGGACPQNPDNELTALTPIPDQVEDCLTVSVWAPDDAADLPVMVWFHGGGLTAGSANQTFYIGDRLAANGVIVVNVNYRLGPYGYLALEELADESDDGSVGNYGLQDQTAALEWVQSNVAAFGGDPDNVTIFGESAGGTSVCGHLASPASDGLFDRAVIQSGGGCRGLIEPEQAYEDGAEVLQATGCADVACLRALPSEQLTALQFDTGLVRDGVVLSEPGQALAADGELDDIPIIIGSNGTEMTLFTLSLTEPTDEQLLEQFGQVTDDPEALLALYPAAEFESNLERYRTMLTEANFVCETLQFAAAATGPVYVYHYLWDSPNDPFGVGPTHGAELVPLFGHPEGIAGLPEADPDNPAQEPDREVSRAVMAAWTGFATDGTLDESWEAYSEGGRVTIIDAEWELADEIRDGRCPDVLELVDFDR